MAADELTHYMEAAAAGRDWRRLLYEAMREVPTSDASLYRHADLQRLHKRVAFALGEEVPAGPVTSRLLDRPDAVNGDLFQKRHKQGAVIPRIAFDEIDENAERIRTALRKLDALDPDVSAAGEALGFFIHKARKDAQ